MNQIGNGDPYYAQFYSRLAPQPGLVPLRPLNLGDILDGSFKVIRRNPRVTLGLSAGIAVLQGIVVATTQSLAIGRLSHAIDNTDPSNPRVDVGSLLRGEGTALVGGLFGALFAVILAGMLTVVVTQDVLGNKLSISEVWGRVRPKLGRLVVVSLLVTIVPFLALFLCLVPGVGLWGMWAVAVPALIVEDGGIGQALRRSWALVRGTFWRVVGIRALGFLIVSVTSALIGVPFAIVAGLVTGHSLFQTSGVGALNVPIGYILITTVGSIIATTFTAPVRAAIDALIYVDLRMRKEGMDLVLQQAAAGLAVGRSGSGGSPSDWNPGAPGGARF